MGETVRPSDGFFLINEFRVARRRDGYPAVLLRAFTEAVRTVARSIEQPIQYAGPGEWGVFPRPVAYVALARRAVGVPGTTADDRCVVVGRELWDGFLDLSLWVEALSIHEWSLFTESVAQLAGAVVRRGDVYTLLTDRPDNRRPLDWERNQVDLLMMEGGCSSARGQASRYAGPSTTISTTSCPCPCTPSTNCGTWRRLTLGSISV